MEPSPLIHGGKWQEEVEIYEEFYIKTSGIKRKNSENIMERIPLCWKTAVMG